MRKHIFQNKIVSWYQENKRALPWRETKDPYKIWLSEIILQQTRVVQGRPYYHKFIEAFPSVKDLASADESRVLRLWQGLGYYSRARNLLACAKVIMKDYSGKFPEDYKSLLKLKGIGDYTAAAIASFSFQQVIPVVDGNVYRVLSRVFGIEKDILSNLGKKEFRNLAEKLISKNSPDIYNQAIMEFGALQCTPKSPNCSQCPLSDNCYANTYNKQSVLPVKEKKIKIKKRYFNYYIFQYQNLIGMKHRHGKDIWQGLYDFYLLESDKNLKEIDLISTLSGSITGLNTKDLTIGSISKTYKHVLTHQHIMASFVQININEKVLELLVEEYGLGFHNKKEYQQLPKPILITNYLKGKIF